MYIYIDLFKDQFMKRNIIVLHFSNYCKQIYNVSREMNDIKKIYILKLLYTFLYLYVYLLLFKDRTVKIIII